MIGGLLTGQGKTAAFSSSYSREYFPPNKKVQALIRPTRELAMQTTKGCKKELSGHIKAWDSELRIRRAACKIFKSVLCAQVLGE